MCTAMFGVRVIIDIGIGNVTNIILGVQYGKVSGLMSIRYGLNAHVIPLIINDFFVTIFVVIRNDHRFLK
jgi:hypothetical protein